MSGATGKRIEAARQRLAQRRAALERLTEAGREARRPVELDQARLGRLSRMDALQVQAMSIETDRRRVVELGRIAAAFARIEVGEYGACLRCGEEIGARRLALDPTVAVCIDCAREGERKG
jgi:DnaK suppressor protein